MSNHSSSNLTNIPRSRRTTIEELRSLLSSPSSPSTTIATMPSDNNQQNTPDIHPHPNNNNHDDDLSDDDSSFSSSYSTESESDHVLEQTGLDLFDQDDFSYDNEDDDDDDDMDSDDEDLDLDSIQAGASVNTRNTMNTMNTASSTIQAMEMFLLPETISVHERHHAQQQKLLQRQLDQQRQEDDENDNENDSSGGSLSKQRHGTKQRLTQSLRSIQGSIQSTKHLINERRKRAVSQHRQRRLERMRLRQLRKLQGHGHQGHGHGQGLSKKELSMAEQAKKREMTTLQEVWNAVTMIGSPAYCIYFIFMGKWLSEQQIELARMNMGMDMDVDRNMGMNMGQDPMQDMFNQSTYTDMDPNASTTPYILTSLSSIPSLIQTLLTNPNTCLSIPSLPHIPAVPPTPLLALMIGIVCHSPCSMLYHFLAAFKLPPGPARLDHWSRRLDQAMIHFIGICWTYGIYGYANQEYCWIGLALNIDSIYRLFQSQVRPRRILYRMIFSFALPTLPLLIKGETLVFCQLVSIYVTSAWLFSKYPFGGWSHGLFHIILTFANPIIMNCVTRMMEKEGFVEFAAQCAVRNVMGDLSGIGESLSMNMVGGS